MSRSSDKVQVTFDAYTELRESAEARRQYDLEMWQHFEAIDDAEWDREWPAKTERNLRCWRAFKLNRTGFE